MGRQPRLLNFEQKVHLAILAKDLLAVGDRILVAVSGGPDSVALVACLVALGPEWNWQVILGHVNHGLRGAECEADVAFVETLGVQLGVPITIRKLCLNKYDAKVNNQSIQEYARGGRYRALEEMLRETGATKIALGHTEDDQAETVLMWMLRGSGTGGLGGMPPKRGEQVVRPLLNISRSEIMAYLRDRHLEFRVDSSNHQPIYLRNRLRQELIPQLKGYSPGVVKVLSRQAEMLRDDHRYLECVAAEAFRRICVSQSEHEIQLERGAFLSLPVTIRRRVLRSSLQQMMGKAQGPRFDEVQCLLNRVERGQSGWAMECHGVKINQEYDQLIIRREGSAKPHFSDLSQPGCVSLPIPGEVVWLPTGQRIVVSMKNSTRVEAEVPSSEMHADAETFTPPLTLRSWMPGDVFCPKGLGGRKKKLQDFFSDIKLPRSQRHKVPLLVAPEGILWVGGLREDERFQVSPSTTSIVIATMTV
ncbi:MAG: tRNA lysidine(34) synthetase TilS [Nitrospirales bacterium]